MIDDSYVTLPRESFSDVEWNGWGKTALNVYAMIGGGRDEW
jgi:hypothetical protein